MIRDQEKWKVMKKESKIYKNKITFMKTAALQLQKFFFIEFFDGELKNLILL